MFQYHEKVVAQGIIQFQIKQNDTLLTFLQVIDLWKNNATFRSFYNNILREVPFVGFFWEHKAVNSQNINQPYEFVVVKTEAFNSIIADKKAFLAYFDKGKQVVQFSNLGRTAELVVPCPIEHHDEDYIHLATFIRNAPTSQLNAFWQIIGATLEQEIQQKTIWLSTSGLGVYWLHARFDVVPKYYTYTPYKTLTQA